LQLLAAVSNSLKYFRRCGAPRTCRRHRVREEGSYGDHNGPRKELARPRQVQNHALISRANSLQPWARCQKYAAGGQVVGPKSSTREIKKRKRSRAVRALGKTVRLGDREHRASS